MPHEELAWRLRAELRTQADRAAATVRPPRWQRADIGPALAVDTLPQSISVAIRAADWASVHTQLAEVLRSRPSRFVLNPAVARTVADEIRSRWPDAQCAATARAGAAVDGTFDLLGYRGLSFRSPDADGIDWHRDPIHDRRMPMAFWARVPYLDPTYGDHKIVWELNRQQHWLTMSRALWLTNDGAYADAMTHDLAAWLEANPPLLGANWASMLELGFRSLSWLWGLHAMLAVPGLNSHEEPWLVDLIVGLDRQLTQIERNLSIYFSPNTHLTGEALALYVAGTALPELAGSTRWLDAGRAVLLNEIERQIEPDGGHAERSTHYHRYTLDFYLLALMTARCSGDLEAERRFEEVLLRLVPFATAMAGVTGRMPRIGDDDAGRLWPITGRDSSDVRDSISLAAVLLDKPEWAPWGVTEEVLWLTANDARSWARALRSTAEDRRVVERRTLPFRAAERRSPAATTHHVLMFPAADRRRSAGERRERPDRRGPMAIERSANGDRRTTHVFPETGYVATATASGDHLVFDVGRHGYLNGGHAHADALAITLALRGKPLLVDPGTPTYTMDLRLRDQLRSSSHHNTVTIDGRSSAIPRGPFHWHTHADAQLDVVRHNAHFAFVEARHEAYATAGHRRVVFASDGGYFVIDEITGQGRHEAAQHWHFDPQWRIGCESRGRLRVAHEGGDRAWLLHDRGALQLVHGDDGSALGWVSPGYGIRVPTWSACVTNADDAPFTLVTWCGGSAASEAPCLERINGASDHDIQPIAVRLQIGLQESVTVVRPEGQLDALAWSVGRYQSDGRAFQCALDGDRFRSLSLADASCARIADLLAVESDGDLADLHVLRRDDRFELTCTAPPSHLRLTGDALAGVRSVSLNGNEFRRETGDGNAIAVLAAHWPVGSVLDVMDEHDVRNRWIR
jgi:hypothetical protein